MNPEPLPEHPLRLLHLGDSYTIGEGVADDQNWPCHFRRLLESMGHRIGESMIIARNGWTTADLLRALNEAGPPSNWDLITLCIGANNQFQALPIEEYQQELGQLLDKSRSLLNSHGQILLLSIPDWSITPFAADRNPSMVQSDIDRYNEALGKTAAAAKIPFIDWTPLTRQFKDTKEAYVEDGLHPSGQQYAAWTQFLVQQLPAPN